MNVLLTGFGAGLGASIRFVFTTKFKQYYTISFPWATLLINLCGAFLLGLLVDLDLPKSWYIFLGIGILGGFTTFSTLNVEFITLKRNNAFALPPYLAATYVGGPLLLFLGLLVGYFLH